MSFPKTGLVDIFRQFLCSLVVGTGTRFDFDYFFAWTIVMTLVYILLKKFLDICRLDSKLFTYTSKWSIAFLYIVAILTRTNLSVTLGV